MIRKRGQPIGNAGIAATGWAGSQVKKAEEMNVFRDNSRSLAKSGEPQLPPNRGTPPDMVYRAQSPAISRQARETQTTTESAESGQPAAQQSPVNPREVADRVYRLMQQELILERERGSGGKR